MVSTTAFATIQAKLYLIFNFTYQAIKTSTLGNISTNPASIMILSTAIVSMVIWYFLSSVIAWWKLRKFPAASWVASFSYFWLAKTTYSGRQYWVHRELQQKHKLLRIGPNELITSHPEIIRRINKERSSYNRSSWYTSGRFNPYYDNMISVQQSDVHTKYKSRVAHAYTGREVLDMEIGMNEQIVKLLNIMKNRYARQSRHLELGLFSCFFTMDVITRLAFGQEFGYLEKETDLYGFFKSLRDLWPRISTSADIPWIRNVLFSTPFLKLFGPKPQDKTGFGALMRRVISIYVLI